MIVEKVDIADAIIGQRYAVYVNGERVPNKRRVKIPLEVVLGEDHILYDASFFPFHDHAMMGNALFEYFVKLEVVSYGSVSEVVESIRYDLEWMRSVAAAYDRIESENDPFKEQQLGKVERKIENLQNSIDKRIYHLTKIDYRGDLNVIRLLNEIGGVYLGEAEIPKEAYLEWIDLFQNRA